MQRIMNYNDFLTLFNSSPELQTYEHFILEKNQVMNITGHDTPEGVRSHLFYDSYLPFASMGENLNRMHVLDIGSGAGFPGLVLKIMYPHMKLTIVEAQNKRCIFLHDIIQKLGLKDVSIIHSRAEELANSFRDSFDLVTARAVAKLNVLVEISAPFVKDGGICLYPKGSNGLEELKTANNAIKQLGLSVESTDEVISDATNMTHIIIKCVKNKETSKIYPRRWFDIVKSPL